MNLLRTKGAERAITLIILMTIFCKFTTANLDLNQFYWINRSDYININIDSFLKREEPINSLTFEQPHSEITRKNYNENHYNLQVDRSREMEPITLNPTDPLKQLEIKEIMHYNDEGHFLAYSFL